MTKHYRITFGDDQELYDIARLFFISVTGIDRDMHRLEWIKDHCCVANYDGTFKTIRSFGVWASEQQIMALLNLGFPEDQIEVLPDKYEEHGSQEKQGP